MFLNRPSGIVTVEVAKSTVVRTMPSSPGARPVMAPGEGLGAGLGLASGVGNGNSLAPVKNDKGADSSELTGGLNR